MEPQWRRRSIKPSLAKPDEAEQRQHLDSSVTTTH